MYNNKRLDYLYENYDIFDTDDFNKSEYDVLETSSAAEKKIIIAVRKHNTSKYYFTKSAFEKIAEADTTKTKQYTQWFLIMLTNYLTNSDFNSVIKIISEDLEVINENLGHFNQLKKTKRFKTINSESYSLKHINNVTDIFQYRTPSELYDSIYPFLDVSIGGLEITLTALANANKGKILVNDSEFMIFKPLTLEACEVFGPFSSWCTSRQGNGMFDHYTNMKKPNGEKSSLLILIKKNYTSKPELMQIHFESQQFCDNSNKNDKNKLITEFIDKSNGVRTFLKEELVNLLIESTKSRQTHKLNGLYLSAIQSFGFFDYIINRFKDDVDNIDFKSLSFAKDVEFKHFKELELLSLVNCNLNAFPRMKYSKKLEVVSFSNNKINTIPLDICNCKNLKSLNISNNHINSFPNEIGNLDISNGGSLINLSIKNNPLKDADIIRLKELLPNALITA